MSDKKPMVPVLPHESPMGDTMLMRIKSEVGTTNH